MSDYQERKDYFKIYRQNNKDKINEIIKCSCGSEITKQHLLRHLKTKKHLSTI